MSDPMVVTELGQNATFYGAWHLVQPSQIVAISRAVVAIALSLIAFKVFSFALTRSSGNTRGLLLVCGCCLFAYSSTQAVDSLEIWRTLNITYSELGVTANLFGAFTSIAALLLIWATIPKLVAEVQSELRSTNAGLRRENELLSAIVDNTTTMVFAKDLAGQYLLINKRFEQVFDLQRETIHGKTDLDLFPTDLAAAFRANDRRVLDRGELLEVEELAPHPDGNHVYASVKFPIRDEHGEIFAIGGVATDITPLTETARQLRETNAFLDSVIENIPSMIFIKETSELRFVRVNRAAEELLGIPREQLKGKNDLDFFPEPEARFFIASDRRVIDELGRIDIPIEPITTRHGTERLLHTKKIVITDEANKPSYLLGISDDVTEQERARKELSELHQELEQRVKLRTVELSGLAAELQSEIEERKKAATELERSNKELDKFAYVASHDLKAPLRAIVNLSEWISEDAEQLLPAESKKHLAQMRQRITRMERLLDDLLAYSQAGRGIGKPESVELEVLVREVLFLLNPPKSISVKIDASPQFASVCKAPLEQVLRNLIDNAVKHHSRSDGMITISVRPLDNVFLEISVADDGPGIDPNYHQRVFEVFKTLRPRDQVEGSGIGLSVVRKVVESLGGTITLESELGQGSVFRFSWPYTLTTG